MRRDFKVGKQPCQDYVPQMDGNEHAIWENVHDCYGPMVEGVMQKTCASTVSFCVSCHRDHHADGYETCGIHSIKKDAPD